MRYLAPIPKQFVDESGVPYAGGTVTVLLSGSSSLANIYQNSHDDELADNPSVLDSNGMWQAFVDAGVALDYIVEDAAGNTVAPYYGIVIDAGSGSGVSKAYVDQNDNAIRESVTEVDRAINNETQRAEQSEQNLLVSINRETERAQNAEAASKTTLSEGIGISIEESTDPVDGHKNYEVKNDGLVDVLIRSPGNTISVKRKSSYTPGTVIYDIEATSDADPAYGKFRQLSTNADSNGTVTYDSIERIGGNSGNIAVVGGTLKLRKGLFHVTCSVMLSNDNIGVDGNYYDVYASIENHMCKFVWDNSFVHGETIEFSLDMYTGNTLSVVPVITGLPVGIVCNLVSMDVHKVSGIAGGGSGADVVHDQTLVGDGTVENPLGVSEVITGAITHLENDKQDKLTEMTSQEVTDLLDELT